MTRPRRRKHRTAAFGTSAIVAVLVTGSAVAAGAAGVLPATRSAGTLAPRGTHAFTPVTGDWEATLGGLHASFELVRYPRGTTYGASAFAVRDLVYQRPATCPPSLTDPSLSTFVAYADGPPPYVLVGSDGRFPFASRSLYGSITAATRATMLQSFTAAGTGRQTCTGHLLFSFAPAARMPVGDGTWRLTAADGSGGTFTVRGGGRIVYGIPLSSIVAQCNTDTTPGSFSGQLALYVAPAGTASGGASGNGAQMTVSLHFTSATTGAGAYVATAAGCEPTTLAFSIARTSAAGA